MKNELFDVTYIVTDKGITYPEKTEEIIVKAGDTVYNSTKKLLTKYAHAQCLSKGFTINIIKSIKVGWC